MQDMNIIEKLEEFKRKIEEMSQQELIEFLDRITPEEAQA